MKRTVVTILAALVVFTLSPVFALDFMVGAKSGYYVWVPYFRDMKGSGIEDIDSGSGVLYGPVVSVLITPDLSLSVAGLFGSQFTLQDFYKLAEDPQGKTAWGGVCHARGAPISKRQ